MPSGKYNKNSNYKYAKKYAKRFKPSQKVVFAGNKRKRTLANKVELIRPITLKPVSVMKKFIYYNTAEVNNNLIADQQNCQFFSMYLNSPWIQNSNVYTNQGNNTWNWNKAITQQPYNSYSAVSQGTSYPGFFGPDEDSSIGLAYQNSCIVGAKVTLTCSPLSEETTTTSGGPTAFFAIMDSQTVSIDQATTIDDLYELPFTTVKKISGGKRTDGQLNGNALSSKIVIKYSPKKFNNINDIKDNHQFFATVLSSNNTGKPPAELDRLSFGLVNVLSVPTIKQKCLKCMIQLKSEVTVLFTEPNKNKNQFPADPVGVGRQIDLM